MRRFPGCPSGDSNPTAMRPAGSPAFTGYRPLSFPVLFHEDARVITR
jgi:hypothetical protein